MRNANPVRTNDRLRRTVSNGARKRLGQNFLTDKNIINNIINELNLTKGDVVLEIGSGHGELTQFLVKRAKKVIACEIDSRLTGELKKQFYNFDNFEIINADFLKLDLERIFLEAKQKLKIIGNLPYYISSPIITRLLENKKYIDSIYLTLQKEFVERIIAKSNSKKKGAFTFFVQYHSKPALLFNISKNCFIPRPKVDSSFIKLEVKKSILNQGDEAVFFRIIRRAFQQRRKTLRNSLKELFPRGILLDNTIFSFNLRPENLSENDFIHLVNMCKKNKL